jgi:F420-dependent oxidoreductase-like protein
MRIGLTATGGSVDRTLAEAERAEAEGFSSLWFASAVTGNPLAAIAVAGRATERIELGTSVLVTYESHPMMLAIRAAGASAAIGTPGRLTLGVGPSHRHVVERQLGLSYDTPGRHTEEYVQVVAQVLRREPVHFAGDEFHVEVDGPVVREGTEVPLLVSALAPRLLRVAGEHADGTILWMANAAAVEGHVVPRIRAAAEGAGRPAPRIVAGLPVVVHGDVDAARAVAAEAFAPYGTLPNYQRILERGGVAGPAEAAIVGDEASVTAQVEGLFAAGATDFWAAPFGVGDDRDERTASRARTRALLRELATA